MTSPLAGEDALLEAMYHRLSDAAVALGLLPEDLTRASAAALDLGDFARASSLLLDRAAERVRGSGDVTRLWLLLATTHGRLPGTEDVLRVRRRFALDRGASRPGSSRWLTDPETFPSHGLSPLLSRLIHDEVLVDAGHTAQADLMTGIQRVVREVLRRWVPSHQVVPAAWTQRQATFRSLTDTELNRLARWGDVATPPHPETKGHLLLPWRTTVFLSEVSHEAEQLDRLVALARFSGSRLVLLGYDTIPTSNAEAVGPGLAAHFAQYLSMVKHAHRVIAISASAGREFAGFSLAVAAQGLPGPDVVVCPLPGQVPPEVDAGTPAAVPTVLVVGTVEPRKNHLAVLHAAEVLWREGLQFSLVLIGKTTPAGASALARVAELQAAGRPLEHRVGVEDADLWRAYRQARFSIFVSTHEGYGLPVAESLASGTPVITTGRGATAEAAAGGGALLVDPSDERTVVHAFRQLLTDDALLADLTAEALVRPARGWDDYSTELWELLGRPTTNATEELS